MLAAAGRAGGACPFGTVKPTFETLVKEHYQDLYRFALSLVKNEADATDLTQQTYLRYAKKGHQIRDYSKVKSWLFTTLRREFYNQAKRSKKFPHVDMESVSEEVGAVSAKAVESMDASLAMDALQRVEEKFRLPLSLFYLQDCSYKEIAATLEIPIGTVMSRLARGKEQLRTLLATCGDAETGVAV